MNSALLIHIPDCTDRCKSTLHGDIISAAITKRSITDLDLCCYLNYICCNCENVRDSMGRTALHMAASCGRTSLVHWLIQNRHANINARDTESGYTPLHRSLFYGKIETALELIKLGALSVLDLNGLSPLEHAMKDGELPNKTKGEVYVWGCNASNALGQKKVRSSPELLNEFHREYPKESVEQMCLEKFHSVIVGSSGRVFSCGHGQGGRLGLGNQQSCVMPKLVTFPDAECVIVHVSIARDHSLFLSEDNSVYSCGQNTFRVLGLFPPPPHVLSPKQVRHFPGTVKGLCTGQYHCVVWGAEFLYTWGLNGGQLGHKPTNDGFIFTPKTVNCINFSGNSMIDVCASDGATAFCTENGDIYVLHEYKCRKVASRHHNVIQINIIGGKLNPDFDKEFHSMNQQTNVLLKIVALTNTGNILLWQENEQQLLRCIFSINRAIIVKQVKINVKELLFVTNDGQAFQGVIKQRKKKFAIHQKNAEKYQFHRFLDKDECIYVKLSKIPKIHRAIHVQSDLKGNDYCVIQELPYRKFHFPDIIQSEFQQNFLNMLNDCSENDNLHDVVFKVDQKYFPAHRFIVASKSTYLKKLLLDQNNEKIVEIAGCSPQDFQKFLYFCYTNNCNINNKGKRSLQELAKKMSCPDLQKYLKTLKLPEMKFDRNSSDFYDLVIMCKDGKQIMAHKCVLAARMEYFNNMFSTRWYNGLKKCSVSMPFSKNIIQALLEYLYTDTLPLDKLENNKETDYLFKILILADELFVTRLKEQCQLFLTNLLTLKNCSQLFQFSHIYNANKLKYCCMKFIIDNLSNLLELRSLEELDADLLKELGQFYVEEKREICCRRVMTPFSTAPSDKEIHFISSTFPVSLSVEIEKKTQKRRSKTHKPDNNESNAEEIKEKYEKDLPIEKTSPILDQRLKVIKLAKEIANEEFVKLSSSFDEFPLLNSPPQSCSKSSPGEFVNSKHKIAKISQKQRKRLSSESMAGNVVESIKNPWKVINSSSSTCGSLDLTANFNIDDIILEEKKQKENLNRIKGKLLIHTQIEDRAIDELNKFYNSDNVTDEIITVNRVDIIGAVALPVWVPKMKKSNYVP